MSYEVNFPNKIKGFTKDFPVLSDIYITQTIRNMEEKYTLVGLDGNAFSIMGYVRTAMKREHCTKEEIDAYTKDAMSSEYNHLINISVEMCDKLNEKAAQ